jgi:hypothetical protein
LFLKRWKSQNEKLKDDLVESMTNFFGPRAFQKGKLLQRARVCLRYIRDQYRCTLTKNPHYQCPPCIPDLEWKCLILDANEKTEVKEEIHHQRIEEGM